MGFWKTNQQFIAPANHVKSVMTDTIGSMKGSK